MRERANRFKTASQTSHHHFCSVHAGCHEPDGEGGRPWLPNCRHLCCSECRARDPCQRGPKQLILPMSVLCSCG